MPRDVYLSLGSNLGDREDHLRTAGDLLKQRIEISGVSSLYETDPVGVTDQPPFLNLVIRGITELSPRELLEFVKGIERDVGRRPTFRWGPRVVDIDILMLGDEVIEEPDLVIPHRELTKRAFVLLPLTEIAPDVVVPGAGMTVHELASKVRGREGVRLVAAPL